MPSTIRIKYERFVTRSESRCMEKVIVASPRSFLSDILPPSSVLAATLPLCPTRGVDSWTGLLTAMILVASSACFLGLSHRTSNCRYTA
jgi:hypothetical protein